jgi:hypothetical protein
VGTATNYARCVLEYPTYDVTDWLVTDVEPAGDDVKYWLLGAAGEAEEQSWLFKQVTIKQIPVKGGGDRLYRQGEDWVEKVSSELARLINLPAARVELASRDGVPGLLSRDTKPRGWSLHGGGVLLAGVDERYRPKTESDRRDNRIGHNLDNVQDVLQDVSPPPGWAAPADFTAFDLFAGFLLFDAWIANRDRHESNWAVLQDGDDALYLSPSFDHGAALGSGVEDPYRRRLLDTLEGVDGWCRSGTAHRFEDCHDVSLVTLARQALERASTAARAHWVQLVTETTPNEWQTVLHRVPSLSVVTANFTDKLLEVNQERIRDECQFDR